MATLESGFEDKLQKALLDEIEQKFIGEEANLAYQFVELVHTRLRAYAERNGYDVEGTIESLQAPELTRSGNRVTVRVGWADEQMARWEFGVSEHTIDGDPVLSFVWQDPPQWVREEFDQARGGGGQFASGWHVFLPEVDHPGIPESRAIRDSLHALRRVMQG